MRKYPLGDSLDSTQHLCLEDVKANQDDWLGQNSAHSEKNDDQLQKIIEIWPKLPIEIRLHIFETIKLVWQPQNQMDNAPSTY